MRPVAHIPRQSAKIMHAPVSRPSAAHSPPHPLLPPAPLAGALTFTLQVRGSLCAPYMRVTDTRYADFCMDCFTLDELKDRAVKSFQIVYEAQCVEGDLLSFYRIPAGEETFLIVGVKSENEQFMRAKIAFSRQS